MYLDAGEKILCTKLTFFLNTRAYLSVSIIWNICTIMKVRGEQICEKIVTIWMYSVYRTKYEREYYEKVTANVIQCPKCKLCQRKIFSDPHLIPCGKSLLWLGCLFFGHQGVFSIKALNSPILYINQIKQAQKLVQVDALEIFCKYSVMLCYTL